jgi:hypothetical protein
MRAKIVLFLLFVFVASLWFFAALDAKAETIFALREANNES